MTNGSEILLWIYVGIISVENERYIVYTNRYLEDVNLAGIVNKLEIKSFYPSTSLKFVPTFSYSAPIRGKVLNYARTLMSEDLFQTVANVMEVLSWTHRLDMWLLASSVLLKIES